MNKNTNLKNFSLKILIMVFILQPTTACAFDTFDMYKDTIHELNRDPKSRKLEGGENDVTNLEGCPVLIKTTKWQEQEIKGFGKNYGREQSWRKGAMYIGTGVSLDLPIKRGWKNISMILKDKTYHSVYIGPWHYASRIKKQIRFFAYQKVEGGEIHYQYESMTEENKNIKEKPFSLSPNAKIAPDKFSLCAVKWTARFGYNAIAEVKSKNPFSKNYLVPTGKVIEAKE